MKALLIDSAARAVRETDCTGLDDMCRLVGGWIERLAVELDDGATLYVDGDGLFKPKAGYFWFDDRPMPVAGDGLVVGREWEKGADHGNEDVTMASSAIMERVRFASRADVQRWALANGGEAAATLASIGEDGQAEMTVTAKVRDLYGSLPEPAPAEDVGATYDGRVDPDGTCRVTVRTPGRRPLPLPLWLHVANHSPNRFNWGYGGSGPAQLALAILCDAAGPERARPHYQMFKWEIVSRLKQDQPWDLAGADVLAWLAEREAAEAVPEGPA